MSPRLASLSVLSVIVVVAAAGCSEPQVPAAQEGDGVHPDSTSQPPSAAPPSTNPSTGAPTELPWEILDCRYVYAQPAADAAAVAADLPEGFELALSIGPRILVGFEVNECSSGTGIDGLVSPQTYVSFWVPVVPPAGWGEEGAGHFVNFDVLVQDEPRRELMASWGAPVHDGTVTRTDASDGGFRIDYTLDDVGTFAITAAGAGPRPGGAGAFDQWTPGSGGLTYWRTDFAASEMYQGPGTVEVDPASRYADWFESPLVPALVTFGTWDYTGGRIERPVAA